MAKYALLLHHAPDRYTDLNEDDLMNIMKDYIAWVEKASADGIYAGGDKLSAAGITEVTSGADGITVHDGPMTEMSEILGGVMFVHAPDLRTVIDMAKEHPHLVHNSKIEIRLVEGEE